MIYLLALPLGVIFFLAALACLAVLVVWRCVRRLLFARQLRRIREIPGPSYSGFSEKPGKTHTRTTYHQGVEE